MPEIDRYKKERHVWLLIGAVSAIVFTGLMSYAISYDLRFEYGFHIAVLTYIIMFVSFIMYAFTQYISTKEVVSILVEKIIGND
jgi:uncharacterized membrane protein